MSKSLWEILVPCQFNTGKPVRTRHHKEWDKQVRKIANGLTILKPTKGQWVDGNALFEERMIPVRIMCTYDEIGKIMDFTASHYRQIAVMAYKVSELVMIRRYDSPTPDIIEPEHVMVARGWVKRGATMYLTEVKMLGLYNLSEYQGLGEDGYRWVHRVYGLSPKQAQEIVNAGVCKSWEGTLTPTQE